MENNISEDLKRELDRLFASKFFFKEPSNKKIILYSLSYLLLLVLGSILHLEIISAFLIVFPLVYVVGARGLKLYIPLVIVGFGVLAFLTSTNMLFWISLHMILAYIIYYMIVNRYSKIIIVIAVPAFLFLALAIYVFLQIRYGIIKIDSQSILSFINSYTDTIVATNQGLDKDLILANFDNIQKTFPVTIFMLLALYSLVLLNYTLGLLGREYIVIPAFPRLSLVMLSVPIGYIYIILTLISMFVSTDENTYSFWSLLLDNSVSIFSLLFVINGLFTAFFFAEVNRLSGVFKPFLVILAFIFSPLFELLGFVDCLFKLRESYIKMKKG